MPRTLLTLTLTDGRLAGLVRGAVERHVAAIERQAGSFPVWTLDDEHAGQVVRVTVTVEPSTNGDA